MRLGIAVGMLVMLGAPVLAAETPLALAEQVYAGYLSGSGTLDYAAIATPELLRARSALEARLAAGEDVGPDFDPLVAGNDIAISDFKAELSPESGDYVASVLVSFSNAGQPVALELVALNLEGDWRLDEVISRMPGNEYFLLDLFSPRVVYPDATFADPRSVAEALYSPYGDPEFLWRSWDESQFFSTGLNGLYARDRQESEEQQSVGRLDFDPFINGQDFDVTGLSFGLPDIAGDMATVVVDFANFEQPQTVTLHFVREAGRWKVDDARNDDPDYPYGLRALLEAPFPQ
jgi:hypothetical protein